MKHTIYNTRITIRIDTTDEHTTHKLARLLNTLPHLKITDITHHTPHDIIQQTQREQNILYFLANEGPHTTMQLYKKTRRLPTRTSYKTLQRDLTSLTLRGHITTTHHTGNGGTYNTYHHNGGTQ